MKITENDVGKKVLLRNNIIGKITIFDKSHMPIYVSHDIGSSFITTGSWHYPDGRYSNPHAEGYDIVGFLEEKKENKCDHKWKCYLGLSESFYYCTKCDVKKF